MYRCPFCNFTTNSLSGLKQHVLRIHIKNNNSHCPICNKRCRRIVQHAERMYFFHDCEKHAMLWFFSMTIRKGRVLKSERYKRAVEITERLCEVR